MTYIFIDNSNLKEHESLLLEYEQKIFIKSFPEPNERESFVEDIIPRVKDGDNRLLRTYCTLVKNDEGEVVGGLVADWYPSCGAMELIYIAVDPDKRGGKIGRNLLDNGIRLMKEALDARGESVKAIFLEVDIPTEIVPGNSSMDPVARLLVWDAWGAKRIPINYVQPPLSKGKQPVCNLMLMCLAGYDTGVEDTLSADLLKAFLADFYKGLDAEGSEYLDYMCEDIDIISEDDKIELSPLKEIPHVSISNSDITTHFSVNGKIGINLPDTCNSFNSYECDLMNYTNQKVRPFKTKFVKYLEGVNILMPSFYSYTSEGVTHHRLSQNTRLKADVSVSIAVSPDEDIKPIAHITLVPSEDETFNNLDYIKFITAFGSKQEQYHPSSPIKVEYEGSYMTFEKLLENILQLNDGNVEIIGEGATQFDIFGIKPLENMEYEDGDLYIDDFFTTRFEPSGEITNILINRIFCGLILGIFDYDRMNAAEIEDTIRPIVKASDSFFVACRGHIFKIEEAEDDVRSAYPKILISPYLLIPSTTLAFNGMALEMCSNLIKKGMKHRFSPNLSHIIQRAEVVLNVEYIENIFHYNSEQEIIREGQRQRCMPERHAKLDKQIEIIKKRINKSSDIIMEGLLAVVAIFGVIEALEKGFDWNPVFILMIVGLVALEVFRWAKTRNIQDL